ncbi:hypothetical protein [Corynebacterium caspium]|uniref:hypothetical protein n=1 Tax=Corynebacterium caspium TaxID=234828 RepID=UPI0003773596|nr:hypothetical protein [Corynebacterium caspium]WKD58944.1 hypothetical protein CCASP_02685 [Corynebacterium caspium DSM 44850]
MHHIRLTTSIVAVLATFSSAFLVPTMADARPLVGNSKSNFQYHSTLGVDTITVLDQETLLPGQHFTVKVLFAKHYNGHIYPKTSGLGFDKALFDAIDHTNFTVKQYTTTAEVKANFPNSELAKLPATLRTELNTNRWQLKERNRQDVKSLAFKTSAGSKYHYVELNDKDYKTDRVGLGHDDLIALEFTFRLKDDAKIADNLHIGGYFSDPNNSAVIASYGKNWHSQLASQTLNVRTTADVELLTKPGEYEPGQKVKLEAKVSPADYQGNVTFHVGTETFTAPVTNQMATAEYTMKEDSVTVTAGLAATATHSAAISAVVHLLKPKGAEPEITDPKEDNTDAPSGQTPGNSGSSAGNYWWAILLGVLGVLGIGGGIAAKNFGLI